MSPGIGFIPDDNCGSIVVGWRRIGLIRHIGLIASLDAEYAPTEGWHPHDCCKACPVIADLAGGFYALRWDCGSIRRDEPHGRQRLLLAGFLRLPQSELDQLFAIVGAQVEDDEVLNVAACVDQ